MKKPNFADKDSRAEMMAEKKMKTMSKTMKKLPSAVKNPKKSGQK